MQSIATMSSKPTDSIESSPTSAPPTPPGPSTTPTSSSRPDSRWFFSRKDLMMTPSFKDGISNEKELMYRQGAASMIQDMGQRLQVAQLCINTAIVYMQRFYMFHSFKQFHRSVIATASLFLAAKVEESPRQLQYLIKASNTYQKREVPVKDTDEYNKQSEELVNIESILLPTLGFDLAVDHPHTHIVICCQLVNAPKELAKMSYLIGTNSLHLTTLCLQYPPTVVACICINLACQWSKFKIQKSKEGKEWFQYVDPHISMDFLDNLTKHVSTVFDRCTSTLKTKILASSEAVRNKEPSQSHHHPPSDKHKVKHKHRGKDHDHHRSKSSQEAKTLEAPSIDQQLHQQPQQQQQRQRQPYHHRHHHNHHSQHSQHNQHNQPPLPPLPPPPKQPQQQPPPPPPPQQQPPPPPPPHAPLKLKLKIPLEVDRKKRKNSNSSSEPVPVAKMSLVMGSAPDMKAILFNNVL